MAREQYPSEKAERFQIRLPDGLREEIRSAAERNGRSMNAEIVHRLQSVGSLRDQFAGQALSGFLGNSKSLGLQHYPAEAAGAAYRVADAMIAAREVKP
ncbi:Arc family DNA-binding protein [Aureimonas fodinaquatilis]|uniref:Arc family DNA-binding protein n=1 Tax=Aureimonas fodinaquatilis TaxID=2565783 RepID=A0A5B0DU01_9HYPH|nr:Arc family DNA-binding protein [Aureimonas fodinaquatilis]KAA0970287.1 Arc family DNA-binding protein [Aureimonas fodinaquatilis]